MMTGKSVITSPAPWTILSLLSTDFHEIRLSDGTPRNPGNERFDVELVMDSSEKKERPERASRPSRQPTPSQEQ